MLSREPSRSSHTSSARSPLSLVWFDSALRGRSSGSIRVRQNKSDFRRSARCQISTWMELLFSWCCTFRRTEMVSAKVVLSQPLKAERQFAATTGSEHHMLLDDAAGGSGPKP